MADKKISELNSADSPLIGNEDLVIVQVGETKKVAVSEVVYDKGYKEIVIGFEGQGTNDPTITIYKNDYGFTATSVRVSQGVYSITFSGNVFFGGINEGVFVSGNNNVYANSYPDDSNLLIINTRDLNNLSLIDFFGSFLIEIKIYN